MKTTLLKETEKMIVILIGSALIAISLNWFLIPANVFASGFTGVAQLISSVIPVSTGILLFLLNIPVAIMGWLKVGKSFTIYSFISVVFTSLFLELIPIHQFSPDIILNAVFGGVITAIGAGIMLKWGASSGGLDIIALLLSRYSDRPIGIYFFLLNGIIVVMSGLLFDPEKALYTLVTLYVTSRVVDAIHTRHVKLTAFIVTQNADKVREEIYQHFTRGITRVPSKGGFTSNDNEVLMIVLTRYELYDLKQILKQTDPKAFTNIVETTEVFGLFRKD
ncbi:hypothetical protein BTS2_0911 [Bacillus sp. TS-2]|nr:hypothetical protein BTS2_0911 [Bacillus sp. TS-2]